MEHECGRTVGNIHNCTAEALRFMEQWNDSRPYVEAYTSGSTGAPKLIRLLKSDMEVSARSTNRYFNIGSSSSMYCPLSAGYIAGKMMIVRAILSGATLWMDAPSNNPKLPSCNSIDLIAAVPSQVEALLRNIGGLRIGSILAGGSAIPHDIEQMLAASGVTAYVSYGMTETCSHVALRRVGCGDPDIYEAMEDIFFTLDNRGCLVIKSGERSFGELVTNDVAELVDNRHFKWKGRYDNVINSGGIKVFPEEIERHIKAQIPKEVEFYISKCADSKWGETPVLVISKDTDDNAKLLATVRNAVPHKAMRPAAVIVKDISHTSSGKIIRL